MAQTVAHKLKIMLKPRTPQSKDAQFDKMNTERASKDRVCASERMLSFMRNRVSQPILCFSLDVRRSQGVGFSHTLIQTSFNIGFVALI